MSEPRNLRPATPVMAPSMLKCDFGNLNEEIRQLEQANAKILHWDVMDGHFVPNLSYGALLIESLRAQTDLIFDAHLMISEPERYLEDYLRAGCDWITFHIEAVPEPVKLLQLIRSAGRLAGIALNPDTPVGAIEAAVGECDLVLVMSVNPGFGGQKFKPESVQKLREVRQMFPPETLLSIDGGIGPDTIGAVAAAGAEVFVAGSSIFDRDCYGTAMTDMLQKAEASIV